jgi:Kef-type K+ transport system membrane component KefB
VLGPQVMTAFERLMGLILTAMSVEMLLGGMRELRQDRRRDGQTIWYGLNTTVLQDVLAWMMDLTDTDTKGSKK